MSDTVKLSKVIVQMGDTEQTLTVEQAKQLRDQLNELFGGHPPPPPVVIERHDHYHRRPWYWESPVWCGTTSGTAADSTIAYLSVDTHS